jgi:hypothetical protein
MICELSREGNCQADFDTKTAAAETNSVPTAIFNTATSFPRRRESSVF